ncbi:MAG TPA: nucleotidyltransferase family protein [Methylibium sp.]|uniref:nucleotidyltransferase family protein n=1 Tax=Methylibium sp. TaxID=2067992 RepID=UPI002DB725F9|nr:nucleotidyltransferase family protein [Methylibium sp.]HEU4460451.1 nucleotidyltransferase family protein [Methylibium sp.]
MPGGEGFASASSPSGRPAGDRSGLQLPALILCAGRGERMRPLTDRVPKPLLPVHGKPLVVWQLEALARDGVREVVINTAWLEEQFPAALGDGSAFGLSIRYSMEGRLHGGALETAGGIVAAAPLLGSERFWVLAGDAWLPDFRFDAAEAAGFAASRDLGLVWLVPNPDHHPDGDFALGDAGDADRVLARDDRHARGSYTYSTVGLFDRKLVAGLVPGERGALRPHLDAAIAARRLAGRIYAGRWADVGTPARWQALQGPA